jgi:energy-coupling factor transporter ATP-binding protein EcfA2
VAELSTPTISIFGGEYNAKRTELRDVAATFIPPVHVFERLLQANNTLLIGPRGSGKTTLLKMLQGAALELWEHPAAELVREGVRYSGIFVPADQAWAEQLRADNLEPTQAREFAVAAFNLHCLRALIKAGEERMGPPLVDSPSHRRVNLDREPIHKLAQETAKQWSIGRPVADLADLRRAITDSIRTLGELRSAEGRRSDPDQVERLADVPHLNLSLLPASMSFIERFNDLAGESEARWAFLFDELELVPSAIENLVLRFLRGSEDRLLFKVSYAPYERDEEIGSFHGPLGPQPGQDYSVLRLTYANKREGFPFSRELIKGELARKKIEAEPEELLGASSLLVESEDVDDGPAQLDYRPDGNAAHLLRELQSRDASFDAYLVRHGFDLDGLADLPEAERARIRKIMPLVAARLAYKRPDVSRWDRLRGRQNVELYSGAEAFYAMMEANPRWLKHVTDRLLVGSSRVSPERQSRVFRDAAAEFTGYLSVLPMRNAPQLRDDAPKQMIERIGQFFKDHYLRQDFNPDAPGSIRIDRDFPDGVMDSIRTLINRGALIPVPERDDADLTSLRGKRFRLAYLQAPLYGLPLRLDRAVNLSEVFTASPSGQLSIYEDTEDAGG